MKCMMKWKDVSFGSIKRFYIDINCCQIIIKLWLDFNKNTNMIGVGNKLILKCMWKNKHVTRGRTFLKKNNEHEGYTYQILKHADS